MRALVDIGNPDAPRGSESWCRSYHQAICRLKREGQFAVSNLKYSLREFRDGEHFTRLDDADGEPFKIWEDFVQYREPYGLGMAADVASAIIEEPDDSRLLRDVLVANGGDRRSEAAKASKAARNQPCTTRLKYGSADYWLARLDRDGFADLAAKVRSGELSANKVAMGLGWRKQSPLKTILKLLPKLTDDECHQLEAKLKAMRR